MQGNASQTASQPSPELGGVFEKLAQVIERLEGKVSSQEEQIGMLSAPKPKKPRKAPKLERDEQGMIKAVDGVPVTRDEQGRLAGLEGPLPE